MSPSEDQGDGGRWGLEYEANDEEPPPLFLRISRRLLTKPPCYSSGTIAVQIRVVLVARVLLRRSVL